MIDDMTDDWTRVDDYVAGLLLPADPALDPRSPPTPPRACPRSTCRRSRGGC
jgi:hypothetical protein